RGEFLITTLPVTNITLMNSSVALLPHFADGKGWTTEVILTNPSDSPLTGTVEFFNPVIHAGGEVLFPHVVTGGGYTTQFMVFRPTGPGKLSFSSQQGTVFSGSTLEQIQ